MENKRLILPSATADETGTRLDSFIAAKSELTRSAAVRLAEQGNVFVLGASEKNKNYRIKEGDTVEIELPPAVPDEAQAQDIPLDVVYEDEDIIVINKPVGMVVHPAAGNLDGTLVNALLHHCRGQLSGIGGVERPGIVHRIDKDTSGLIVAAKNDAAHVALAAQLSDHSMSRVYTALAVGGFRDDGGRVDAPIGRCPTDRKKMAVIKDPEKQAKAAVTNYTVVERYHGFTRLSCRLETGRTHQIRVHMSYIGHPLMGDTLYGGGHTRFEKENARLIDGQCLHAGELTLAHPKTGQRMTFTCPLPPEMEKLIAKLRVIE
jgi:23S rRNA pseudouridine1911/1915/1917 synthase